MKKIYKQIVRFYIIQNLLSWIISVYLKICYHTSSWYVKDYNYLDKLLKKNDSFIVCFWHGRLLMTPYCWNHKKKFFMLISGHPDGRIISRAISHFGINTIVGSSSRNKMSSYKNIIQEIKKKNIIGITPDGPRGPEKKIKDGIVSLAKLSNIPIIPLSFGAKYKRNLKSWDKFLLVFPFNKFIAIWGKPIHFRKEEPNDGNKKKLENELNRITKLADNLSL